MTFINENKDQIRIVVRVNNYGRDGSIRFRVCDIMVNMKNWPHLKTMWNTPAGNYARSEEATWERDAG